MSSKTRLLWGLACAAMLVAFGGILFPATIPDGVSDFSVGLSAALMVGVLVSSRHDSRGEAHGARGYQPRG